MKSWQTTVTVKVAIWAIACCLLVPASVQASEKTGIYVTPKVTGNFMNWQVHDATDAATHVWKTQGPVNATGFGAFDFSSEKSNTLWGGALAIGYDFSPRFDLPLRVELEYGRYSNISGGSDYTMPATLANQVIGIAPYNPNRTSQVDLELKLQNIQTLLLNAYWDFHNSTSFTPYIGAGLGVAFIQVDASATTYLPQSSTPVHYDSSIGTRNNTNFAWQVGVGCSYDITDTIALDLGYRFMGLGSVESDSIHMTDVNQATNKIILSANGKGEARDIYMHQIALGVRISF